MAVPLTLIQTAPPMIQQQQQQTPHSPNSRPSTADSMKSPVSASAATAAQEKRKTSRRANTAERRATHNAVERQRRETLNGRFLDLASLLPNLNSVRRPSKSAIVNSSIALIHQQRRQKSLAALELRALYTQFLALKAEADEWRARAGVGCVEEGERSREFWELVREGDEVLNNNSEKEAMRRVREVGEEESRARVLAEAASSTSHGARREDDDDDGLLAEDDLPVPPATAAPEPTAVPAANAAHLAHQQHLAQVHAQAQAQIHAAQQVQVQQQQQQQAQMMMRARAATLSSIQVPQAQFAHQVPQQQQQQQQVYHHHQQQQQQQQYFHQQQQQIPFDSGADLYSVADLYAYQAQQQQQPVLKTEVGWPAAPATFVLPSPPMFADDCSSSSSASGSPSPHLGRSRAGSLVQVPVPVAAGFY